MIKLKSASVQKLTPLAIDLRKNATDSELLLWRHLRGKHFEEMKFRKQQPLGKYIVDFVSLENKLVVELDGGQHVASAVKDRERDHWLQEQGFTVLRFWDNEVLSNVTGVLKTIKHALAHPPLASP